MGKFNLDGDLLEKWTIPTDKTDNGDHVLNDIAKSIKNNTPLSSIKGIGFGVPGPVHHNVVLSCVNLGWARKNVVEEFSNIIQDNNIVIAVANDANAAAAGEMFKGVAKGYINVVLYTLGTGAGGGIIFEDKLVEGVDGAGGELGHMRVDFHHNYHCKCGKIGCLETIASATGIVRLAKEYLVHYKNKSLLRRYENFSAKKVFDYAKQGDYIAEKTIDEAMKYLAFSMANISYTINPGIIVIGGGVSNAGDYIIKKIEKYYYEMVKPFITHTNFAIASLGNDAGIYGCCYLIK